MNSLNYPTLSACQRLEKAGIVMETEAVWRIPQWAIGNKEPVPELMSKYKADAYHQYDTDNNFLFAIVYPAPCLAEVWRELPEDNGKLIVLMEDWLSKTKDDWYHCDPEICFLETVRNVDRLIDLLIWLKGKGKEKI